MAFYNVSSDLIQKIGTDLYKINLATIAKQVEFKKADGTKDSIQNALTNLITKVEALQSTSDGSANVYVVDDIAAKDALTGVNTGSICYVKDASADPTVNAGAASYLWDGTKWDKLTEFESLDLVLSWENIDNKPAWVDKFDTDENGNVTIDGVEVGMNQGGVYKATVTGADPDYEAEIAKLGDIPDNSAIFVYRETPTQEGGTPITRQRSFSMKRK